MNVFRTRKRNISEFRLFIYVRLAVIGCMLMILTSCLVRSPKYSTLNQVISLQIGMTKAEVDELLGVQPYDLKALSDTSITYIYVYRVTERRTFSFNTKPLNGKEVTGKYVQLAIMYSKNNQVINIESCSLCPSNLETTSKIDFGEVLVFITVTLPILLIYFGLK